jgi:hypothetical protein
MNYKLLILGHDPGSWDYVTISTHLLTLSIKQALEKLPHITVFSRPLNTDNLPEADFIIVIEYVGELKPNDFVKIRNQTKALKIVSLREIPVAEVDHSFVYTASYPATTFIPPPYAKDLLSVTPKQPKTILIDHYWEPLLHSEWDWTFDIEEWLEDLKDEYTIYRIIRFKDEEKTIKSFEIPIPASNYKTYLAKTAHIESFIITHGECFPYGIIDMVTRGTRVLCPPKFIPSTLVDMFELPIFKNKQEFINIVTKPLEPVWSTKYQHCISYDEVAVIMDSAFQEWLKSK